MHRYSVLWDIPGETFQPTQVVARFRYLDHAKAFLATLPGTNYRLIDSGGQLIARSGTL